MKAPLAIAERLPKLSSGSSVVSDVSTNNNTSQVENNEVSVAETTTATTTQKTTHSVAYLAHAPSFNCHLCTSEHSSYNRLRGDH